MVEPNLESLIKDLYNYARHDLSEDLVAALLETAKNCLLQMSNCWQSVSQAWSIVNCSRILDIRHLSCSTWLALLKEKNPSTEELQLLRLCTESSLKCFDSMAN